MYISNSSSTKPASHRVGVIWLICIVIRYLYARKTTFKSKSVKKKIGQVNKLWHLFCSYLVQCKADEVQQNSVIVTFFFLSQGQKTLTFTANEVDKHFSLCFHILFSERCPRHKMLQKGRNHISRDVETWINDEMLTVSPSPSDLPGGDFTAQPSLFIHVTSWW